MRRFLSLALAVLASMQLSAPAMAGSARHRAGVMAGPSQVENFIRTYFTAWTETRMEKPETLARQLDFYADTVNIFKNPSLVDPAVDFSKPYRFDSSLCGRQDVTCKGDIMERLVVRFTKACPGLLHDPRQFAIKPVGGNLWEAWAFYNFQTTCRWDASKPPVASNIPTVSVYTVDMNQTRADGGRGRIVRVINILSANDPK